MKKLPASSLQPSSAAGSRKKPGRRRGRPLARPRTRTNRRRARDSLRANGLQFRAIVDQSPFATVVFAPSGGVLHVNEAHLRLWGVTRESVLKFNLFKDPQIEALGLWPFFRRAFAGEPLTVPPLEYDLSAALGAGNKKIVQGDLYPVHDAKGKVTSVIVIHRDVTQLARAEEAVRATEARLRLALDVTGAGTWEVDLRSGRVVIDRKSLADLGYSPDEAPGTIEDWVDLQHPEDKAFAMAAFQDLLQGKTDLYHVEQRTRRKDGTWAWSDCRARIAERTKEGLPARIIGTHVNIDERKQAEAALRESESKFRALFESAHDAILLMAPEVILSCNPRALSLFGCSPDDLVGHSPAELSPPTQLDGRTSAEKAQALIGLALQGYPQSFEWRHQRSNGTTFDAEVSLKRVELAGGSCLQAIVRDVSERKRAEEDLREYQRRLADIIQFLPDPTLAIDRNKRVLVWNKAIEEMTGIPAAEMIGQGDHAYTIPFYGERRSQLMDLVFEDSAVTAARYPRIVRQGDTLTAEFFCNALYSNQGAWVYAKAAPLYDGSGRIIGAIESIRDITSHKRAVEALRASEQRLRLALDVASAHVWDLDLRTEQITLEPESMLRLGYSSDEIPKSVAEWYAFQHPDDRPRVKAAFEALIRGEIDTCITDHRIRRKDGQWSWIEARGCVFERGPDGHPLRVIGTSVDVTERKRAERIIQRLSDLGRELGSASTATAAAQAVANVADDLIGWDACFLKLRTTAEGDAVSLLSVDQVDGQRQSLDSMVGREVMPVEHRVRECGAQLILREDPGKEERFAMFGAVNRPAASLMYVPLRHQGRHLGLFAIHSYRLRAYTQADLELLQGLADYAAGALERIRAEEAFRASEARYGMLVNTMKDILYSLSSEGKIQFIGRQVRAYGYLETELLGKDFLPYIHPEDRAGVLRDFQRTSIKGEETQSTFRFLDQQGGSHWFEEIGRAVRDEAGNVVAVSGLMRDVTERKQAEEALRISEERYRELFDFSPDGIVILDPQTARPLEFNEVAHRQLGYSREEFARLSLDEIDIQEKPEEIRARIQSVLDGKRPDFETRHRTKQGETRYVHVTAQLLKVAGRRIYHCIWRDITDQKRAEERIRQQAALLDVSNDAVLVWDVENGIQFMNPAAQQLTGMTFAQGRAQPLSALLRPRSEVELEAAFQQVTIDGNWSGELTLLAAGEKPRVVASRWTLLPDTEGKPASVLITCNDITEKKQLESQYLRAQRLESVGTLASGVAHDLNNILSPVLMGVDLLGMTAADEEARGVLKMMKESARRGVDTVKQLLTFARGTEAQKGPVQPRYLLKEIARLLQQTFPKNIQIYTDYARELATVLGDPSQLHQVLMNLCVNARDAMPDGGVLFLRLENRRLNDADAKIHPKARPGSYVVFKVTDSGTGIPPEILDRIFDPFFTTKPQGKGTGLGLATVLGIVEDHGGFVLVESKLKQGTTFEVFLPAGVAMDQAEEVQETPATPRGQGELVLVVDDEPAILHLAGEILRHGGYSTLTASNASEALQLYEQNHDRICGVLTDIMMPFGDGRQLIMMLYEQDPRLPIIAMSGLATKEFQRDTLLRGARAFIRKPFGAEELLALVAELLPSRHSGVPLASGLPGATPPTAVSGPRRQSEVAPANEPSPRDQTILLVDSDPETRRTVGQALRVLGYEVHDAPDEQQALSLWQIHGTRIDLLLVAMHEPAGWSGVGLVERLKALKPNLLAILSADHPFEANRGSFGDGPDVMYLLRPYEMKTLAELVRNCLGRQA